MNKRPRVSLLLTPTFAGMGLSAQEKNQLFLAFIPRMTDPGYFRIKGENKPPLTLGSSETTFSDCKERNGSVPTEKCEGIEIPQNSLS